LIRRLLLYTFAFLLSFSISVVAITQMGVVKRRSFALLQTYVEEVSGYQLVSADFHLLGPFAFTCSDVVVEENKKPFARAKSIYVTLNPLSLFSGVVELSHFSIDELIALSSHPMNVVGKGQYTPPQSALASIEGTYPHQEDSIVKLGLVVEGKKIQFHLDGKKEIEGIPICADAFGTVYLDATQIEGEVECVGSVDALLIKGGGDFKYAFEEEKIAANFSLDLDEKSLPYFPHFDLGDKLSIKVNVKGNLAAPEIELFVEENDLNISYLHFRELQLETNIYRKGLGFQSELELKGKVEELPFKVKTNAIWEGKELVKVEGLSIEIPEACATGSILYDVDNRVIQASCSVVTDQLADTLPNTDLDFFGHLIARLNIVTSLDEHYIPFDPKIEIDIDSSVLEVGSLRIKDLDVSLDIDQVNGQTHFETHLLAGEVVYGEERFTSVKFDVDFTEDILSPFSLTAYHDEKMEMKGQVHFVDGEFKCFLDKCKGAYHNFPFEVYKGGYFSLNDKGITVDGINVVFGQSEFTLQGKYFDEYVRIYSTSDQVLLEELATLFPKFPCTGKAQYELTLEGPVDALECKAALHVDQLNINGYPQDKLLPVSGDVSLLLEHNALSIQGDLAGMSDEGIHLQGTIPCQFSLLPLSLAIPIDQPLEGSVTIEGEISPFLGFLLSDTTCVTGDGILRLDAKGTLLNPELFGSLEISNGTYESLVMGSIYQNITAKLEMVENQLLLKKMEGFDTKGGLVTGSGHVLLDPDQNFPFDILLDFTNSQLLNLDYADSLATGKIHFKGTSQVGLLVGDLSLIDGTITLPDETPALLNTIEVEYINQPKEERAPTTYTNPEDPWPVKFDIRLNIPQGINVGSKNWSSSWRGSLDLRGSTDDPLIYGQGKIV